MSLHEDTNILNSTKIADNVKRKCSGKINVNSKSSKNKQSFGRSKVNINKTIFLGNQATETQFRMSKKSLKVTPKISKDIILTAQYEDKQKNVIKHSKKFPFISEKNESTVICLNMLNILKNHLSLSWQ